MKILILCQAHTAHPQGRSLYQHITGRDGVLADPLGQEGTAERPKAGGGQGGTPEMGTPARLIPALPPHAAPGAQSPQGGPVCGARGVCRTRSSPSQARPLLLAEWEAGRTAREHDDVYFCTLGLGLLWEQGGTPGLKCGVHSIGGPFVHRPQVKAH